MAPAGEDFSAIQHLNIFTSGGDTVHHRQCQCLPSSIPTGVDKLSRPVVVFSISNIPSREVVDMDQLIRYAVLSHASS